MLFRSVDAANAIVAAIERVLAKESGRTRDLGGRLNTIECGKAITAEI